MPACGAEPKSTFCLARGRRAWVGHHIGDLHNWETLRSFEEGIVEAVAVQHHRAHLAACLAEHGWADTAVAAVFDGAAWAAVARLARSELSPVTTSAGRLFAAADLAAGAAPGVAAGGGG